jgi:hypothetical protein
LRICPVGFDAILAAFRMLPATRPFLFRSSTMKSLASLFVAFGLFAIVGMAFGAEDGKRQNRKARRADPTTAIKTKLESLDLSAEQKAKIEKIVSEQGPKLKEATEKAAASLTEEQRQARTEAQKAARAEGKKRKQAQEDINAAMKLTAEQQKAFAEATKAQLDARQSLIAAVSEVLTPEQREKAGLDSRRKKKSN